LALCNVCTDLEAGDHRCFEGDCIGGTLEVDTEEVEARLGRLAILGVMLELTKSDGGAGNVLRRNFNHVF
jgi:hypothetical protein